MTVPKSGHFVPTDNYAASKSYLDDFINFGVLQCLNTTTNCSQAAEMCNMMANCTDPDHGTCGANGQCICKDLHKGADCAYTALKPANESISNYVVDTTGKYWFYLSQNATTSDDPAWSVTLNSDSVDFNLYIGFGEASNPNQFTHDMAFKGISAGANFVLSKNIVPDGGFTAAVQVEGYDAYHNQALQNKFSVMY